MPKPFEGPVPAIGPGGQPILELGEAFVKAAIEVNRGRSSFTGGDVTVGAWPDHPDLLKVKDWLERRNSEPDELEVIYWLATNVRAEWEHLPKRTTTEHRELHARIQRLCVELDAALRETGSPYYRGGGHGLMAASVRELLTDSEKSALSQALADSGGIDNAEVNWAFPRMDDLLKRLGAAAKRLHDAGPMHSQPNKRGAERGYFVRRMGELFQQRYGEAPAEVLASITTVALDEVTDRELVTKLLK